MGGAVQTPAINAIRVILPGPCTLRFHCYQSTALGRTCVGGGVLPRRVILEQQSENYRSRNDHVRKCQREEKRNQNCYRYCVRLHVRSTVHVGVG